MKNINGYNRAIKLVRYGDPITVMVLLNQLNLGPGSLHHKYGRSCVYWINSGQFAVSIWSIGIFTIIQNDSQPPTFYDFNYSLNIYLINSLFHPQDHRLLWRILSMSGTPESASTKQWVSFLADILVFPFQAVDWCPAQPRPLSLLQCHVVRVTPGQWWWLFLLKFPVSPPVLCCVWHLALGRSRLVPSQPAEPFNTTYPGPIHPQQ